MYDSVQKNLVYSDIIKTEVFGEIIYEKFFFILPNNILINILVSEILKSPNSKVNSYDLTLIVKGIS